MGKRTDAGHKHAEKVGEYLKTKYKYVLKEGRVRGWAKVMVDPTPSGVGDKRTKFKLNEKGQAARADFLVSNDGKTWTVVEAKLTENAPYQTQQKIHYPNIDKYGGKLYQFQESLTGEKPKGRTVRSTLTIYESDLTALENELRDWDEFKKSRIGKLGPPEDSPKITQESHDRATKNNGVTEDSRGRDKKRRAKKRKRRRKRQQAVKRAARREKAEASQKKSKPKNKKPLSKAASLTPSNVRPKGLKFLDKAGKGTLGFGANLLIDISVDLMLSMLESRLGEVNQEGIERAFSDRVYEKILKKWIDLTVYQAKQGLLQAKKELRNTPVYIRYRYTILMERQAETLSDAVIFMARLLLLQGSDFVEVYHDLIADPEIEWQIGTPKKFVVRQRRKKTKDEDIFAYKYKQHLLVWDPTIFKLYQAILEQKEELDIKLKAAFDKAWLRKPDNWFFSVQSELGELLKKYQFQSSLNLLNDTKRVPDNRSDEFDDLKSALQIADGYLGVVSLMSKQHQALLAMYLEVNPFIGRRKALNREARRKSAERIKKLRNQKWTPPPPGSGGRMW